MKNEWISVAALNIAALRLFYVKLTHFLHLML